jgi:hypothetical protein
MWRGQKFILRADVSQFYSSLYTHAIPWALHGKTDAKARKSKTAGDRLDKAVRNCSSSQTVGIPVGPDTSVVVAEIVLAAVDASFHERVPNLRGFRYFDDYEAAFQTRSKAEEAQSHLEAALEDFELTLNPSKSYVLELPQPFKTTWTTELSTFPIRDGGSEVLADTISLFSRAAELAKKQPGALTYALRKSQEIPVDGNSWRTFQALVWSAVSAEPTTMAVALDLLEVKSAEAESPVDPVGASEALEALLLRNAPLRNASEVAWALWAASQFEVDLSPDAGEAVSTVEDDFVALLALDAEERGRFPEQTLEKSTWEALIDSEHALESEHWLLAYEGTFQGWLTSGKKLIGSDSLFTELFDQEVSFYDRWPTRAPFTGPAGPLGGEDYDD